jgi:hypothetical protein
MGSFSRGTSYVLFIFATLVSVPPTAAQVDVLTQRADNARVSRSR